MTDKLVIKPKFQSNTVLPPEYVIKGADSHLYKLGLSLFESRTKIKRKWYFSPGLVWTYILLSLLKHLALLLFDVGDYLGGDYYRLIICDADYFMESIGVLNIVVIICDLIILCSQLINVYNKWNGIKPDLRLFEMMAGFTSPESIGLKDERLVLKLIKFTKRALNSARLNTDMLTINLFAFALLVLSLRPSPLTFFPKIGFKLLWAFHYAIWVHYIVSIMYYQFAYFIILCYYLHLKLSQINQRIVNKETNIYRIIVELTAVFQEIGHYNSNYWSKYLLVMYAAMSSLIANITFVSTVVGMANPLIKAMFFSYSVLNSLFLLVTIGFSALIYNDCKYTYRILSYYVHSFKRMPVRYRIKLLALMERIAKKRIGFHCWKLFIINSKVGLEVLAIIVAVFFRTCEFYFKQQVDQQYMDLIAHGGSLDEQIIY